MTTTTTTTTTNSPVGDSQDSNDDSSTKTTQKMNKITKVSVRLMFLRIGEIDTLNEKYQAQLAIESRWIVDADRLSSQLSPDDQRRLAEGKSVSLLKYAESNWHPQLYIENALGDLKEQIRYSAKKSRDDQQVYVCEQRDVKGVFWEKLELHHFPSDVQDLSISIGSMFYDDKVTLLADPNLMSGVNREAFVDQQEWSLYEHVDTTQRHVAEFLFRSATDEDEEGEEDGVQQNQGGNSEDRKRSILTITCHAARQSNYFYWNGYCLIFLIAVVSFCIFGIPTHQAANRIQIACTLLLTSITFRWTVNRSLPTISYLTSMDKYAIMCIFNLIIHCIWHAIVGAITFLYTRDFRAVPGLWITTLDQCVFFVALGIFVIGHLFLIGWLFLVPLKYRRQLKINDREYRLQILEKKSSRGHPSSRREKNNADFARIPIGN